MGYLSSGTRQGRRTWLAGEHPGFGNPLRVNAVVNVDRRSHRRSDILSHATVSRMMQLDFSMYADTRFFTSSMSLALPADPTLAIKPSSSCQYRAF